MGALESICIPNDADNDTLQEEEVKQNLIDENKRNRNGFFIAFNEVCTKDTTFQCTLIHTTLDKDSFTIQSTDNLPYEALYNAGKRITATCSTRPESKMFYALVQKRNPSIDLDESCIQKYRLITKKNSTSFNIEFVEEIGTFFKDCSVNCEGIGVIQSDEDKDSVKGFLVVNDVYDQNSKNSILYYINNQMETKALISLNDGGASELNDICSLHAFGRNGYLVLPQSLNLGYVDDDNKINWSAFEKWMLSNVGDASLLFVDKNDVLNAIETDANVAFERIRVRLEDNWNSKESVFYKCRQKKEGYCVEGYEALAIDEDNNMLLILECSRYNDTFDYIMTARFVADGDKLEIVIDPCKYEKIDNNGGGPNHAQEALLYCSFQ